MLAVACNSRLTFRERVCVRPLSHSKTRTPRTQRPTQKTFHIHQPYCCDGDSATTRVRAHLSCCSRRRQPHPPSPAHRCRDTVEHSHRLILLRTRASVQKPDLHITQLYAVLALPIGVGDGDVARRLEPERWRRRGHTALLCASKRHTPTHTHPFRLARERETFCHVYTLHDENKVGDIADLRSGHARTDRSGAGGGVVCRLTTPAHVSARVRC